MDNTAPNVSPVATVPLGSPPDVPASEKPGVPKKVLLIVGTSVVFILLVIIALVVSLQNSGSNLSRSHTNTNPVPTPSSQTSHSPSRPPLVRFENYKNNAKELVLANTYKTYALKTHFTQAEMTSFAQKLGLTPSTSDGKTVTFINTQDPQKRGFLFFHSASGSFSYHSLAVQTPSVLSKPYVPQLAAARALVDLGISDETITCPDTYQKKELKNVTFVECHRDWGKLGAPLLQLPGVLNMAETAALSDIKPGITTKDLPRDPTILAASSGQDGKARPNDFNTATVALTKTGEILSIESTLRWIESSSTVKTGILLSQDEAVAEFSNHKAEFSLTLPSGRGTVSWNAVYPDNKARAKTATIQEIVLAYTERERNTSQPQYALSYVIRGTADLDSGYTVRFVESIPALRENVASARVAGASVILAQANNDIQIGTFRPPTGTVGTPTLSARPTQGFMPLPTTTPTPTGAPTLSFPELCRDQKGQDIVLNVAGYGTLTVALFVDDSGSSTQHTYFFKSTTEKNPSIESVKKAFFSLITDQCIILSARDFKQRLQQLNLSPQDPQVAQQQISYCDAPQQGIVMPEEYKQPILQAVMNAATSGTLDTLANKPDIFPPETVNQFHYILVDGTNAFRPNMPYAGFQGSCYITGGTPMVFLYPARSQNVSVSTHALLTYSDPPANDTTWFVTAAPDGSLKTLTGITRNVLYYEYNKASVHFSDTKEGFIVKKEEIKQFAQNLGEKIGLKKAQIDGLFKELTKAAAPFTESSNYLKVSLIREKEIREKLPLSISPPPDTLYRLHFLVTPTDENSVITQPTLPKIERVGFTVLEIGAYSY